MTAYWFRPKRYGYGATPVTWQGWALTLAVPAVLAASIIGMNLYADRSNGAAWLIWGIFVALLAAVFIRVSRTRTSGEWRWRWGAGRDQTNIE